MKIHFLGTSHGIAEIGRFNTCMLAEIHNVLYMIDMGAPFGTILKNKGMKFSDVRAAFITHMHDDHARNITEYLGLCNFDGIRCELYLPEGLKAVEEWNYAMHCEESYSKGFCVLKEVSKGNFFDDGNLRVEAMPTKHLKRGVSYAYEFFAEGKRVLFTGDLSDNFDDFPKTDKHYDLIVCELTHFDVSLALDALNKVKTEFIVFNHVRDDKIKMLCKCGNKVKFNYHIANDGDVISV